MEEKIYRPVNHVRIVSAASLFDGHDVAINIMRRMLQNNGVEVIHIGHNRSVEEIVNTAVQEDVQAIAVTSYQGGHMEFFTYMVDLLKKKSAPHVKIFGGGGGVILPDEIQKLEAYGITRIYSPDDGMKMGLQGMINDVVRQSDFPLPEPEHMDLSEVGKGEHSRLPRYLTLLENEPAKIRTSLARLQKECSRKAPVIGFTGTGGAGKSSLLDELIRRFLQDNPRASLAVISVDPSKRKTGGALLGDRIRMNAIYHPHVFMRSLATRQSHKTLSRSMSDILCLVQTAGFDLIFLESSGIGQSNTEIVDHSDLSVYVMTPEYGAASQLEKIDMLDYADLVVINKFDKQGGQDALRDVKKQVQRNRHAFDREPVEMPVFGTIASTFNDAGVEHFYKVLMEFIIEKTGKKFKIAGKKVSVARTGEVTTIIPNNRIRYLSEISETVKKYNTAAEEQAKIAGRLHSLRQTLGILEENGTDEVGMSELKELYKQTEKKLSPENRKIIRTWDKKAARYRHKTFTYKVRGKDIRIETHTRTLSHLDIPKVILPRYHSWEDRIRWTLKENVPGEFPYASGVFPFKREQEDPTRMFAGEGGPERTNKRFHFLSMGLPAKRLSTAFDSVTLYGADPDPRPDIYGKIGNSGVSISCLDDAKKLYSGFNLMDAATSVSMTINGPAPIMVGYFMNAAVDQQCEIYIRKHGLTREIEKKIGEIFSKVNVPRPEYHGKLPDGNDGLGLMLLGVTGDQVLPAGIYRKIKAETLSRVRGTVQADILKEDQAQNTCIFSTDFALKMMGDMQEYFIENRIRNFYSVSVSGYHIAEAGANPVTQLAFTLANGFTYLEYYRSRGMDIDDFAPNFSFFFSSGMDPEYTVIGRVARIIWAKAMKYLYGADERSQKLKYHIQTSGRSLHAQEIEFNDIRTTLQALNAIYDNCNSLHTNAYDEAITTPTEESVRRAMAIQLIINHELGIAKNQNPFQGSFIIEELTDLVEEAVLAEFDRITSRGGVLGAMETMYQRSKIQEESMYYEKLKHSGELPIMGVNTFLPPGGMHTTVPEEVIRAHRKEKDWQIEAVRNLKKRHPEHTLKVLEALRTTARQNGNVFASLMEAAKYATLGQLSDALYESGGQYRRNM
ncbi:MAG: methylmalonyl-CoA mutase family protein [Chlorobi bacterium]|nr:methylmalonyl-CoA mutase family protein [Chlorobiota bacterium]